MARKGKLSQIEKEIFKITIDGNFKQLITAYRDNGNGLKVKVRKGRIITHESIEKAQSIYEKRYPGKKVEIICLTNGSQTLKTSYST